MRTLRSFAAGIASAAILLAASPLAFAHAILVRSTPADHSVVHTHSVDLVLQYNSRIDAARCTVTLTDASGKEVPIQKESSANPGELKAAAHDLANGNYRIHWQVLASDGHITRGEVNFSVQLPVPK